MQRLTNQTGGGFTACNGCVKPQCVGCKEFIKQSARMWAYEETGLEPEEVVDLKNELDTAKEAICQMCRKRGEEQHILSACVSCKYGGKENGT